MADVRFLRHLRDAHRTTLVHGRKVNKHEAAESRLEQAKSGGSFLLQRIQSLTSAGKANKARQDNTERKYQWLTEAQRLRDVSRGTLKEVCDHLGAIAGIQGLEECVLIRLSALDSSLANEQQQRQLVAMLRDLRSQLNITETLAPRADSKQARPRGAARMAKAGATPRVGSAGNHSWAAVGGQAGGEGRAAIVHAREMMKRIHADEEACAAQCEAEASEVKGEIERLSRAVAEMEEEEAEERQRAQEERFGSLAEIKIEGSEAIMMELYTVICRLDEGYVEQLRLLNDEEQDDASRGSKWSPRRHTHFMKVYKECRIRWGDTSTGVGGRAVLTKQLRREFPGVPADELDSLIEATERRKRCKDRRKTLLQAWLERRDAGVREAMGRFRTLEAAEIERLTREAEKEAHDAKREEALGRLAELKDKFLEAEAARKAEEAIEAQAEAERQGLAKARYKEERRRKKEDVAAYRERKEEEARHRFLLRIVHCWRNARAERAAAELNAKRVGYRVNAYWDKVERMHRKRQEEERLCEEAEERLARLRATVAPVVPDDPNRHLGETAADAAYRLAREIGERETGTRKYATNERNFYSGYTMGQLMGDTRMRLAMALHSQGLDNTKAGREAMMRIQGSLVPRKDMFTSEQLGRATALAVGSG